MTRTGERILLGVSVVLFIALIASQTVWGKGGKPNSGAVTVANDAVTI
jgi:hypothetical protein